MKKVAVFGSTGMVGQPVTQALLNSGYAIKALVRDVSKAQQSGLTGNMEFVQGSVEHTTDIEKVIDSVDFVYISLSVDMTSKELDFQPEREGVAKIIEVAKQENVKCISYLSGLLTNYFEQNKGKWWVYDKIRNANIKKIEQSGLPYILFKPSFFMENFTNGLRQGNKIALAGTSLYPMYMISAADYAKMVVKAFDLFDGKSRSYAIQGPEALTVDEAAKLFVDNYKKETLKIMKAPLKMLKLIGLFSKKMKFIANISEAINHYEEGFLSEKVWKTLPKPNITIQDFARLQNR